MVAVVVLVVVVVAVVVADAAQRGDGGQECASRDGTSHGDRDFS